MLVDSDRPAGAPWSRFAAENALAGVLTPGSSG